METQKYYTPTIEEFYVGFEYENYVKHIGWTKRVVESLDEVKFNEKGFCLDNDDYRVKCLDQEDILDLGWKDIGGIYVKENNSCKVFINLHDDGSVFISDEYEDIFKGKIKNKSELKKIIQMLEISE